MTDQISPKQFSESEGVEDWRVLGDGANAYFRTGSYGVGARLVQAISKLPGVDDLQPDVDVRQDGVTVRMVAFIEQAEARIAAALAAGGRMVRDEFAPSWWTLADAAGNEADVATTKGRD